MKTKYITLAFAAMMTGLMFTACQKEDNSPSGNNNGGNGGNGGETPSAVGGFREDGASNALFTVAEGRQVRFSRGNLQYQASTGTWRFAENQYEYIGENNINISQTYDGWIDLFAWGNSGWESGATSYQPWELPLQWNANYPGGDENNDLTGDYAEADWAWHNAISNGGNQTHKWRTLTGEEWNYLISTRAGADGKNGIGTVNEVHGMILLPDTWALPEGLSFSSECTGWDDNVYTVEQWEKMENAGAVFFPAAGYSHNGYSRHYFWQGGETGGYWASTHYDSDESRMMFFDATGVSGDWWATRPAGRSVRPVTD